MSDRNVRLNFTPHDRQQEVLNSDARFRVVVAGRRSGKTIMAAVETVRRALQGDSDWHGYWVGAEHRHADTAYTLVDKAIPNRLVARRKNSPPRLIEFVDGQVLEFHTSGGGALVSVGLDWVVADEAAKNFPERSWTEELRPALSDREGDAMFISTPSGRGWFYEWYQRGKSPDHADTESFRWSTYENPHVPDEEIDGAKEELPDRIFRQEYEAEFISETGGVFEGLDEHLFTDAYDVPVPPEESEGPYSIGVDLARHEDFRVIVVMDATGRIVSFDRKQGESWPQIQSAVMSMADRYPGIVSIDASRDNKLVADLEHSGLEIRPVKFSSSRKQALVENLVAAIESDELTAPEIPELRHELEVFEYDVTRAGNVRYHAPEGFHDDTVDSLALALDGMGDVKRQGVSATATVGGEEYESGGQDITKVAREIDRQQRNARRKWK